MTTLIRPGPTRRKAQLPRTQANYESLVELVKRILSATKAGTGGTKKIIGIHNMILGWRIPDGSEILSPHTHSSAEPEELNPPPRVRAPMRPAPKKRGAPKPQVSRGGIVLPGDPSFKVP